MSSALRFGDRFILTPVPQVEQRLSSERNELDSDVTSLEKKLHYLETTHKNSREHMDRILGSGGRS
jgi:prefoldin subunit 1